MLKIYGTLRCPDCVNCLADLDKAGISYEFQDFDQDLRALREFLKLRDGSALFDAVREAGAIGIPCILDGDGTLSLTWQAYL